MIPLPYMPPTATESEIHDAHKMHVRDLMQQNQYVGLDRQWVRKYHAWAGHLSRLPRDRWASKALLEKNVTWWRQQQRNPEGHRHTRSRGNLSRWENALVRHADRHDC